MIKHSFLRVGRDAKTATLLDHITEPDGICVEVGTCVGELACQLAGVFREVHCIDPWKMYNAWGNNDELQDWSGLEERFDENTAGFDNVKKIKGCDQAVVGQYGEGSINVVYLDAVHTLGDTVLSMFLWWPKIKPGGKLSGHDYSVAFPGVLQAVDTLADMIGQRPILFPDSSWSFDKP